MLELGTAGTGGSCPHVPVSPNPRQSQADRGCFHVQRPLQLRFAAPLRALGKVQEESQNCPDFGEAQMLLFPCSCSLILWGFIEGKVKKNLVQGELSGEEEGGRLGLGTSVGTLQCKIT